tara:strand:- start:4248 stop:5210 length:963 start_codon:yes stop_codon:yes gene_type:complete
MKVDVSFVILSFNDSDLVVKAVQSIKKLKTKYSYDIFVVDNGSSDNTPEIIKNKFPNLNLILLNNNIGTAAYDKAIKFSTSKYVYFTGCDIEVRDDMLDFLVDFLEKYNNVVQVSPKYLNYKNKNKIDLGGTWLSRSFYSGIISSPIQIDMVKEIPYIGTGLIRKSFIQEYNYLFDPGYFFYGEDVDLGLRIRLTGKKIYYLPNSVVYHKGSQSRKVHNSDYLTYLMERNLLRTFFTNLEFKNIIIFFPYVFIMRIIGIIRDLFKFQFKDSLARVKAIFYVILNFDSIFNKRISVQKKRIIKDNKLLKVFSEKYIWKQRF